MGNNQLTVVGGQYRGFKLQSPQDQHTHPMGAREKNALFNRLAGRLAGAKVLDAYAGSGALAAEALSRGAAEVVLVEKAPKVAAVAQRNLAQLAPQAKNWRVETSTVSEFAERATETFDLIIADPPYDRLDLAELSQVARLLALDGVFVLSHPRKLTPPQFTGLEQISSKSYAGATITFYQLNMVR